MVLGMGRQPVRPARRRMNRILIVSDEEFLRDLMRFTLADMPVEIRCARGLTEMRHHCRRGVFDLVIVLRVAPFLCGDDPVRELRPRGLRRPVFYVVTWQQAEHTVLSLLECGVDQYLTFPLSLGRLRAKVAAEIDRRS